MILDNQTMFGDALEVLKTIPDESVQMCVTSPPYWGLRDYGHSDQIGLEETPEEYIKRLVLVFREVKRVLKEDGTVWVNIGDSYCSTAPGTKSAPIHIKGCKQAKKDSFVVNRPQVPTGLKPKDLVGIPWMLAFALRSDGWYLRQDIIWSKPNPMPESVTDRCTKSHEYIFLLSKSRKYYYDHEAIKEESITKENRPHGVTRNRIYNYDSKDNNNPEAYRKNRSLKKGGVPNLNKQQNHSDSISTFDLKNKRSVWFQSTKPYSGAHFAVYPPELITDCIKAGSREGDIVLDPFFGSGTTGEVCLRLYRAYLGIELNKDFEPLIEERLKPFKNDLFAHLMEEVE